MRNFTPANVNSPLAAALQNLGMAYLGGIQSPGEIERKRAESDLLQSQTRESRLAGDKTQAGLTANSDLANAVRVYAAGARNNEYDPLGALASLGPAAFAGEGIGGAGDLSDLLRMIASLNGSEDQISRAAAGAGGSPLSAGQRFTSDAIAGVERDARGQEVRLLGMEEAGLNGRNDADNLSNRIEQELIQSGTTQREDMSNTAAGQRNEASIAGEMARLLSSQEFDGGQNAADRTNKLDVAAMKDSGGAGALGPDEVSELAGKALLNGMSEEILAVMQSNPELFLTVKAETERLIDEGALPGAAALQAMSGVETSPADPGGIFGYGASAPSATRTSPIAPPAGSRTPGKVYETPQGPMTWTGTGWLPAS